MKQKKSDSEYKMHVSFSLPMSLVAEMRKIRKKKGTPISQQVAEGIFLYLEKSREVVQ